MKYTANRFAPTFQSQDFNRFPPSVASLPDYLIINGSKVYPTLRYNGKDAGVAEWNPQGYGEVLNIQIIGDVNPVVLNQGSPFLGSLDDSVKFDSGEFYKSSTAFANVTTEHIVFEFIGNWSTGTYFTFGNFTDAAVPGWLVYFAAGVPYFYVTDGTDFNQAYGTATTGWTHLMGFYRAGDRIQIFQNGVAGTSASTTAVGSLTTANLLTIGSSVTAGNPHLGNISQVSMWKQASWLDTSIQTTVAANRYAQLTQSRPVVSYSGVSTLAAKGSSTAVYTQRFENSSGSSKLYYLGATTPRWQEVIDGNGKKFRGMLNEVAGTNICLQSQAFDTTWGAANLSAFGADVLALNGLVVADSIVPNSTSGVHYVGQSITLTATTYVMSCYAKAGNRSWFGLSDDTLGTAIASTALFNVSTGELGAKGANIATSGIVALGSGWYRCYASFTGTVASHNFRYYVSDGNNLSAYTGDNATIGMYLFGAQVEIGIYPSSYIPTTTAAVTKTVDSNYYTLAAGDATPSQGTLAFEFWAPTFTPDSNRYLLALTDTTNNNHISLYLESTTGKLYVTSYSTGGSSQVASILTSASVCNNLVHKVILYWSLTSCTLVVDGTVVGTDATFDAPTAFSRLNIGSAWNASLQSGPALVGNIQIYPAPTTRIVFGSASSVNDAAVRGGGEW